MLAARARRARFVALGIGQRALDASARATLVQAPRFEVDPLWPKPLPNHWVLGNVIGVGVDANDHVFIVHRNDTFDARNEIGAAQNPPLERVLRPGAAGARVRSGRQPRESVGRAAGRQAVRLAVVQSRHLDRQQEQRLDRRQRRPRGRRQRLPHPQVHARRQIPDADRRPRSADEQQQHDSFRPRREDLVRRTRRTRRSSPTATATGASR